MYYLGIDGGGSKTSFTICNGNMEVVDSITKGEMHYQQISFDKFEHLLLDGVSEITNNSGISIDEITNMFIGIPGYGENVSDRMQLDKIISRCLESKYITGNDVLAAWCGALNGMQGICVSAGTGSIAYGEDSYGNQSRAGGWGCFCGDQGSSFWVGKKVIESFCKISESGDYDSEIYNLVKEKLRMNYDYEIINLVSRNNKIDRSFVASFSVVAYEAALNNDPLALSFFSQAANELAELVIMVKRKLKFNKEDDIIVSYNGGMFKSEGVLIKKLEESLHDYDERFILSSPVYSSDIGACLLAKLRK